MKDVLFLRTGLWSSHLTHQDMSGCADIGIEAWIRNIPKSIRDGFKNYRKALK